MVGMTDIQPNQRKVPQFGQRHRMALALETADLGVLDAADKLGVSRDTLGNWLSGRTRPKDYAVRAVADICRVDERWLLTGIPSTFGGPANAECAPRDSNPEPAVHRPQMLLFPLAA